MQNGNNSSMNDPNSNRHELLNNLKTLFNEHVQGIPPIVLEEKYETMFKKSLLYELIQLSFPDVFNKYISITPEHGNSNSVDQNAVQKKTGDNYQTITASGIVPSRFNYIPNLFMTDNNKIFLAFISHIDERTQCIYVQPESFMQYKHKLTEELGLYYSAPISEELLVKDIMPGLACVTKFGDTYHRVSIKENHPTKCSIFCVDLGITMEVDKNEIQLKYLLNYFGKWPCMALATRLFGVELKLDHYQIPRETLSQLKHMCQTGPYYVEPHNRLNDILYVKIFDNQNHCLNDYLVEQGQAFTTTAMPSMVGIENGKDQRETNNLALSVHAPSNGVHKISAITKPSDANSDHLLEDYETDNNVNTGSTSRQQSVTRQPPGSRSQNDYTTRDSFERSNSKTSTHSTNDKKSNSTSQRNGQYDGKPFPITFRTKNIGAGRLFGAAVSGLSQNSKDNRRPVSQSAKTIFEPIRDDFSDWMCSWANGESLWLSDGHRNAMLKYIGRIYDQKQFVHRIFADLGDSIRQYDELDLLKKLLESTKQRRAAQVSKSKWEDNARIDRRVKDLRVMFEFDGNYSSTHGFKVSPNGLQKIIDRRRIRAYFDLGCGDGDITAGIGHYLGLTRDNILGGDIYEGQNKDIIFTKIDPNQSTIALPDNSVDLITSFVTFHHVSQLDKILAEITRILRPGGYLILREHDCRNERSLSAKYLNFVHAIMLIAEVGEFARPRNDANSSSDDDYENTTDNWSEQKLQIIDHTKAIHYRSCNEWQQELANVGFRLCATLFYGADGADNPQKLFYGVFQLDNK